MPYYQFWQLSHADVDEEPHEGLNEADAVAEAVAITEFYRRNREQGRGAKRPPE